MKKIGREGLWSCSGADLRRVGVFDDVEGDHFGLATGCAISQREVLVVDFERVGQGEEKADGDRRHDHRDGDVAQHLPAAHPVELGCFN